MVSPVGHQQRLRGEAIENARASSTVPRHLVEASRRRDRWALVLRPLGWQNQFVPLTGCRGRVALEREGPDACIDADGSTRLYRDAALSDLALLDIAVNPDTDDRVDQHAAPG